MSRRGYLLDSFVHYLSLFSLIATVAIAVVGFIDHSGHVGCLRLHEQTGLETRHVGGVMGGCYINVGGQWTPAGRWRVTQVRP